jgi:internalin A
MYAAQDAAAIEDPADYDAITRAAPFLTELSLKFPGSATALPQQLASLLSACSKLEDLTLCAYDEAYVGTYMWQPPVSSLVDVDALLAAGPQLLHLKLPSCSNLTNLAPLRGLVNLQSLDISSCEKVSDLTPLGALLSLQSLDMSWCSSVSDMAPLTALVNLQSLNISYCGEVSDLAPLAALVNLRSLDMNYCKKVSDLAPQKPAENRFG